MHLYLSFFSGKPNMGNSFQFSQMTNKIMKWNEIPVVPDTVLRPAFNEENN